MTVEDRSGRPRLVLLGASNLTRGFPRVLEAAQRTLGAADLEVFAALGHGRSYGLWSRVLMRGLPGIADCGLWPQALARLHEATGLYGLLTDIGNDLIYGASPEQTAGWVETCLRRLTDAGAAVVVTRLPLAGMERLTSWRFHLLRTFLFPTHPASLPELRRKAVELDRRLVELAADYGAAWVEPDPTWYGFDAIHLRSRAHHRAWAEILARWPAPKAAERAAGTPLSRLAWLVMAPERRRLLGVERRRRQPSGRLADGTEVWLY